MSLLRLIRFHFHAWRLERLRARRLRHLRDHFNAQPARRGNMVFGARQQGWTLLEAMIVVLIIGIASAVAIPAYAGYVVRSQVSESIQLADGMEKAVGEAFQANGLLPNSLATAGLTSDALGKYTDCAMYDNGVIGCTFSANAPSAIAAKVLTFKPYLTADGVSLSFVCGYATPLANWTVPANDGSNGGGPNPGTTVSAAYIPRNCRAGG